jgi:hypothetical protein
MAVSFAQVIRSLFTDMDIAHMKDLELRWTTSATCAIQPTRVTRRDDPPDREPRAAEQIRSVTLNVPILQQLQAEPVPVDAQAGRSAALPGQTRVPARVFSGAMRRPRARPWIPRVPAEPPA